MKPGMWPDGEESAPTRQKQLGSAALYSYNGAMALIELEPEQSSSGKTVQDDELADFPLQAQASLVWEFGADGNDAPGSSYHYVVWQGDASAYELRQKPRKEYELDAGRDVGRDFTVIDAAPVVEVPVTISGTSDVSSPGIAAEAMPGSQVSTSDSATAEAYHLDAAKVRYWLDVALEHWQQAGRLPPQLLLRDGLLVLKAGYELEEAHRALLLRTALYYQRGMLTALRFQRDPQQIAYLLRDALLNFERPLSPLVVWQLKQDDPGSARWGPLLASELRTEMKLSPEPRRTMARMALAQLASDQPFEEAIEIPGAIAVPVMTPRTRWRLWSLLLILVVAAAWLAWQLVGTSRTDMVRIPAGTYQVGDRTEPSSVRQIELDEFWIDRHEVTNAMYRQCYQNGACPWPASEASATRASYFLDPAYAQYPVVHVDWTAADSFCRWRGGRLPTADEWEVAAGSALATKRHFRYPWGDQFDARLANSAESRLGDTRPVGLYHPAGDSSSGAMDMAGNVAEWTMTKSAAPGDSFVVKGGSFMDDAQALRVSASMDVPLYTHANWLGFRCVREEP